VVVDRERRSVIAAIHVEEGKVPPVVEGEAVVLAGPVAHALLEEAHALVHATLHLHHVGDGVHGPAVLGRELERAQAGSFGLRVLVALLHSEGVHPDHERVAGQPWRPCREHARDAVAKVERVTANEVHEVRELDREDVARVLDQDAVEGGHAAMPVADRQLASGCRKESLPLGGLGEGGSALVQRGQRVVGKAALEKTQKDQCFGRVGGGEVGGKRERLFDRCNRIAPIGPQGPKRALVRLQGGVVGEGQGQSAGVFVHARVRQGWEGRIIPTSWYVARTKATNATYKMLKILQIAHTLRYVWLLLLMFPAPATPKRPGNGSSTPPRR
jgi:hypothetical protein